MVPWGRQRDRRHDGPPAPPVRARAGSVGLLTARLSCGTCHTAIGVDAAAKTLRHGPDRTTYPLRVGESERAWLLEWTCPACATPSSFSLPKVLPG